LILLNYPTSENGGEAHKDRNDDSQITAKVIVVQFTKELGPLDEHKHMLYELIGTGKGLCSKMNSDRSDLVQEDRKPRLSGQTQRQRSPSTEARLSLRIPLDNEVTY
jgi:hypothetical protein